MTKREELEELENKVENLQNIIKEICPHKVVKKKNFGPKFLFKREFDDVFGQIYICELCGSHLTDKQAKENSCKIRVDKLTPLKKNKTKKKLKMDEIDKSILIITILTMIFSSVLIKLIKPTTIVALGVLTSVFVVGSAIFLLNVVYNESS